MIKETINSVFIATLAEIGKELQVPSLEENTILLESGLDSLGFAIVVAKLEDELGYDPFQILENPVYPTSYGEFIKIYESTYPQ